MFQHQTFDHCAQVAWAVVRTTSHVRDRYSFNFQPIHTQMVVFREKRKHVCIHQQCCHDDFHHVTHFEDNTTLHTHRLPRHCRISRASCSITTWSLHDPSGIRRLGHGEESLDQSHSLITGDRMCPNRRRICLRMLQSHVYEGLPRTQHVASSCVCRELHVKSSWTWRGTLP